jgi:hypothetical protein
MQLIFRQLSNNFLPAARRPKKIYCMAEPKLIFGNQAFFGGAMRDRRNNGMVDAATVLSRLMDKWAGKSADAPTQELPQAMGSEFAGKSIVEVTEALLRQVSKRD